MSLLQKLNQEYIAVHHRKEELFWQSKMGLQGYVNGEFEKAEQAYKAWIANPKYLPQIEKELSLTSLSTIEHEGLTGWKRFFTVNAISDPEAIKLLNELVEEEGLLETKRSEMQLGYRDPNSGSFIKSSFGELSLMISNESQESLRRAAWEGIHAIGPFILENGFIEIIKKRNQLAQRLGYEDYYDYKVQVNEGISKRMLFKILDELEALTRDACKQNVDAVTLDKGASALQGWNFRYLTSSDLTKEMDPYFAFDTALIRWARSFAAMGVSYNGAAIQLDLIDRQGKHHNGFMHGPLPAYMENDIFHPAAINFTANAIPNHVGSGKDALMTLFHEGGHAAHFANIQMPAPCFSQEFSPTSIAFAETQSMFFDSLIEDADWLYRYARDQDQQTIPFDLIKKNLEKCHRFRANAIRSMLVVSYVEKSLYEMPETDLNAKSIMEMVNHWEKKMHFLETASRPVLAIPHIISGEASAYYHGYILAEMAVYQTKDYFLKKYGSIVDNPAIGKDLTNIYWRCGNSKNFLTLIEELTGEPFSARATGALINQSLDRVMDQAQQAIDRIKRQPMGPDNPNLGGTIKLVHGDLVIASTESHSLKEMADIYSDYVRKNFPPKENTAPRT